MILIMRTYALWKNIGGPRSEKRIVEHMEIRRDELIIWYVALIIGVYV